MKFLLSSSLQYQAKYYYKYQQSYTGKSWHTQPAIGFSTYSPLLLARQSFNSPLFQRPVLKWTQGGRGSGFTWEAQMNCLHLCFLGHPPFTRCSIINHFRLWHISFLRAAVWWFKRPIVNNSIKESILQF